MDFLNIRVGPYPALLSIWDLNLTLGAPCLGKPGLDLLLPLDKVELLLQSKNEKQPLFSAIHYFAMSDATVPRKLKPRLLLAKRYLGKHTSSITLDACRTTAIFGTGIKGTQLQERIINKSNFNSLEMSPGCVVGDRNIVEFYESIKYEDNSLMEDFWMLLNDEDVAKWFDIYNLIMEEDSQFTLEFDEQDVAGSIDVAKQMTNIISVDRKIFDFWKNFKSGERVQNKRLTASAGRREANRQMFTTQKHVKRAA